MKKPPPFLKVMDKTKSKVLSDFATQITPARCGLSDKSLVMSTQDSFRKRGSKLFKPAISIASPSMEKL